MLPLILLHGAPGDCGVFETNESQPQQYVLYLELPNRVEEAKKKREVLAIFEVMADLAGTNEGTPSMKEEVDDDTPMGHVSKHIKVGIDGDGVPIGSPNRIDDHAKSTTEDPMGRPEMNRHCNRIPQKEDHRGTRRQDTYEDDGAFSVDEHVWDEHGL